MAKILLYFMIGLIAIITINSTGGSEGWLFVFGIELLIIGSVFGKKHSKNKK